MTRFGVLLPWRNHRIELLIDTPGPFPGFSQLRGLRKRLANACPSMGDLTPGPLDAIKRFLLAGLKPVDPILEPGNQPCRVNRAQISGRKPKPLDRHSVKADRDRGLAESLLDAGHQLKPCERTRMNDPRPQPRQLTNLP
ncbi:MAG TPA: hypothetical protein VFI65_00950, partial [Streptosporangiaceae bacterium]|nr:hypothetical protein [Streptosporangiaceae bacterium]